MFDYNKILYEYIKIKQYKKLSTKLFTIRNRMYYNKGTNKVAYTFPPYHIGNPLGTRVSGGLSFLSLQTKKPQKDSSAALRMINRVTRFSVTSSVVETSLPPHRGAASLVKGRCPEGAEGLSPYCNPPLRKGDLLLPFLKKAPLVKGGWRYS